MSLNLFSIGFSIWYLGGLWYLCPQYAHSTVICVLNLITKNDDALLLCSRTWHSEVLEWHNAFSWPWLLFQLSVFIYIYIFISIFLKYYHLMVWYIYLILGWLDAYFLVPRFIPASRRLSSACHTARARPTRQALRPRCSDPQSQSTLSQQRGWLEAGGTRAYASLVSRPQCARGLEARGRRVNLH